MSDKQRRRGEVVWQALLVVLVLQTWAGLAQGSLHGPKSKVVQLTKDNFRSLVVETGKAAIVEFYDEGHQISFNAAPIFDALALDYGGFITVGIVDMKQEKELTTFFSHRENTEPFVVLFPPEKEELEPGVEPREKGPFAGKPFTYYQGPIEPAELAEFALSPLHSRYVVRVTETNLHEFHDERIPKAFWFSDSNAGPPLLVQALSQAFQGRMKVGYVRRNDTGVFDHYGMPHGEVRLLAIDKSWQMHHYGGRPTGSRIFRFLNRHAIPIPGEPTPTPASPPQRPSRRRAKDEL